MYIVAIAWMFVVVLMAAAEAMSGALLGAVGTLFLYGLLPLALVLYLLATPARRRARAQREADGICRSVEAATTIGPALQPPSGSGGSQSGETAEQVSSADPR
jgi:hypothetical protein